MNKNKMGRPYISGNPKTIRLTVRLDENEHKELIKKAKTNNMGVAEYIRFLIKRDK